LSSVNYIGLEHASRAPVIRLVPDGWIKLCCIQLCDGIHYW